MAPHSSTLAWKIPWTEEPGRLQSMGSLRVGTRLSDFTFTFHFHALETEMATHSSVLAWRTPGMGEPGGLPSMGSHRVRHYWSDLAAAAGERIGTYLLAYVQKSLRKDKQETENTNCPKGGGWMSGRLSPIWETCCILHFFKCWIMWPCYLFKNEKWIWKEPWKDKHYVQKLSNTWPKL